MKTKKIITIGTLQEVSPKSRFLAHWRSEVPSVIIDEVCEANLPGTTIKVTVEVLNEGNKENT